MADLLPGRWDLACPSEERAKEAEALLSDGKGGMTLAGIDPVPEVLLGLELRRGRTVLDGVEARVWVEEPDGSYRRLDEEEQAAVDRAGARDAAEWREERWGTEADVVRSTLERRETRVTAWFESLWSPPDAAAATLRGKMPDVEMECVYEAGGGEVDY